MFPSDPGGEKRSPITLSDALSASRTLGQAINRSGTWNIMVLENDDELFQLNQQAIWYTLPLSISDTGAQ